MCYVLVPGQIIVCKEADLNQTFNIIALCCASSSYAQKHKKQQCRTDPMSLAHLHSPYS